jgi:hypothetical protein
MVNPETRKIFFFVLFLLCAMKYTEVFYLLWLEKKKHTLELDIKHCLKDLLGVHRLYIVWISVVNIRLFGEMFQECNNGNSNCTVFTVCIHMDVR